jgi:hypothetical protein
LVTQCDYFCGTPLIGWLSRCSTLFTSHSRELHNVSCDGDVAAPRYDHYFLRTASYDVPSEAKSAFALEMDDVRVMMRDCTHRSLVMLDELG